jgi:hypothetical protein
MGGRVERHPAHGAARRVGTQIRPVTAVLHAQDLAQLHDGAAGCGTDGVDERGDQRAGAVTGHDGGGQVLAGEHAHDVRGDLGGKTGVGRVGQVVADRDLDPVARRPGAEHDQARLGYEAEQVRDNGKHGGRRANLHRRPVFAGVHRSFLP